MNCISSEGTFKADGLWSNGITQGLVLNLFNKSSLSTTAYLSTIKIHCTKPIYSFNIKTLNDYENPVDFNNGYNFILLKSLAFGKRADLKIGVVLLGANGPLNKEEPLQISDDDTIQIPFGGIANI